MGDSYLDCMIFYSEIGHDVTLTKVAGIDGIRMTKRYSFHRKREVTSEQAIPHQRLENTDRLKSILEHLYKDIEKQEKKRKYYEPHY